jgi:pantoate--beta-alanine ligase
MHQSDLPTVQTVDSLRRTVAGWRASGERIALVPTMGALHAGHLALVALARQKAHRVVASIFVNPRQFAPGEDFESYPRTEAEDARKLAEAGCDLLYAPGPAAMYPPGFATRIEVGGVSEPLEGAARPAFFGGVATVVAKLLIQAAPDVALFGEKDYQQLQVIRRLARDLDLPVEIVGGPTVREPDGLALSSRNAYLSPDERVVAGRLNVVLSQAAELALADGEVEQAERGAREALIAAGFRSVDYVEVRRSDDLERFEGRIDAPARILAAARIGRTRLIDNLPVG